MAGGAVDRLEPGDHLCLLYESAAERTAAVVPWLRAGIARGERCLVLAEAEALGEIERALRGAGAGEGREPDRGALVLLTPADACDVGAAGAAGGFVPGALTDLLRQAEQQALDDGFAGLRAACEMTWAAEGAAGGLIEYEALLNRFLPGSRTIAICQYDRTRIPKRLVQDVLRTHPRAAVDGGVCTNCFFEPPEMVLAGGPAEERSDWMVAQLRRAGATEQEMTALARRLDQQEAALRWAEKSREEFLAALAHELRNPLSAISNAIQVLRHSGSGGETWRRALDTAERQVQHQSLLVDDLLDASEVTEGRVELDREPLEFAGLVRETVEVYRGALREARLKLILELPPGPLRVEGDRRRLAQALTHLIDNAIKFTRPGGRIEVAVEPAEGRRAVVRVRDTGSGISRELLPHVFEPFTQAEQSLDRRRGGLGVGLTVAKALVELHGGELAADSAGERQGAELILTLPLAAEQPASGEASAEEGKAAGGPARRILVVEDNPDAAATLREFLELAGHQVALAATGIDGVEAARRFHPEVVLCDIGLPGMNGYEVAARLRRDPATARVQLIAVTGYGRDEDRRRSKAAGFDLHLTKPVDPTHLRKLLQGSPRHH